MAKKVIILNFPENSLSYQAFSEIKKLVLEGKIKGEQMAVVSHGDKGDHKFQIDDFLDFTGNNHSANDGLIGMLIGILVGPLGIVLGWFTGTIIGSTRDMKDVQHAKTIFEHVISQIKEGQTGLILIAGEDDNRPLNQIVFDELGGEIQRVDLTQVEEDLTEAKKMEKENAKAKKRSQNNEKD